MWPMCCCLNSMIFILTVTLTGFPVSSSNATKDLPMLISSDFLQMTPLSKQSTFSAVTLSITSALLCGGEKNTFTGTAKSEKLRIHVDTESNNI